MGQKQMCRLFPLKSGRKKRFLYAAVGALSAVVLTVSGSLTNAPLLMAEAAEAVETADEEPLLENLILDRVYSLQALEGKNGHTAGSTGFVPEVRNYRGTAYESVDKVRVYPFAKSDTAEIRVNDEELNGEGYAEADVSVPGEHDVKVEVRDGGKTSEYMVEIQKTDADYRGRKPIISDEENADSMSVETSENPEKLLEILNKENAVVLPESGKADGSYAETSESFWSFPAEKMPDVSGKLNGKEQAAQLFTVDLGRMYSISRIRAVFGPANLSVKKNKSRISVSEDGKSWLTPVDQGNLNTGVQYHQNVTRYEFGGSYQARYIRFEVTNWQHPQKELRMYQFMIYHDPEERPEKQKPPENGSKPHEHEERHKNLSGGQATVIERGIPMTGWTPSRGYGRGIPTSDEAELFGYDGPLFYDPGFENLDYMLYNPDVLWSIAKAPFGGNGMGDAGKPREFVPESMKKYISNAVSFCFGDEGGYSRMEAEKFGEWFQWTREHYPGVILHTNQFPNQWSEENLREYMEIAQPDMLTWDDYYGDRNWANPSSIDLSKEEIQRNAARRLMNLPTWSRYRKLAWEGIDGTGEKPILFGQYLDAFAYNHSQSNKNLVANLSVLSGAKWLNFFRVEYQFDRSYLFDEDGTPTRGLLEWGEIIDRIHAIDPQLTRLNNDWIMYKMGEVGDRGSGSSAKADGFRSGDFDAEESREKNREFGLAQVEAESMSKEHEGKTGDIVLGYYHPLPGLYESEIREYFNGSAAPKSFMIMNGLTAGKAERYNEFKIRERERGSCENTKQKITVTAEPEFARSHKLYKVNKDKRDESGKGIIEEVSIKDNKFTVILGGGETELYFWDTDGMV